MMLAPLHSVTAVLIDAVHMARDAKAALARGDVGLAVSAVANAHSWIGMSHAWASQKDAQGYGDWQLQLRRVKRVARYVRSLTRDVMAVVDGRCGVMIIKAPAIAPQKGN